MKRILIGLALAATTSACGISTQQEVQMGTDYAQQINAQLPIVKDPEVVRTINSETVRPRVIARVTSSRSRSSKRSWESSLLLAWANRGTHIWNG